MGCEKCTQSKQNRRPAGEKGDKTRQDDYDYYQGYVPVDHGITVELSPGYISGSTMLVLTLYDSSNSQVDVDYYSNPQSVSTNGTGTNLGGTNAFIGVWAYNGGTCTTCRFGCLA